MKSIDSWKGRAMAATVALAVVLVNVGLGALGSSLAMRAASALGIVFILALAMALSERRSLFPARTVAVGLGLQFALALFIMKTDFGAWIFRDVLGRAFERLIGFGMGGAGFVFGSLADVSDQSRFALGVQIAAVIVFVGALTRMLYHVGALQVAVKGMAWLMRRTMRVSGAESLSAAANVFVGMVEGPLMVRPYVAGMTRSEVFCLMTVGMATVAGTVLGLYASFVQDVFGAMSSAAGHLIAASIMSAPAAVLVAKVMVPETGEPLTADADLVPDLDEGEHKPVNLMDAAARGSIEGMHLGIAVIGILVAFISIVAMVNAALSGLIGLTAQEIVGALCAPVALGIGIPIEDAMRAGSLIGEKTVLNEFIAYQSLAGAAGELSPRSAKVMAYALCGFANFGSLGIMIAGVGGLAASQRPTLARLGLMSIVGGSLAAFMTACLAGVLL